MPSPTSLAGREFPGIYSFWVAQRSGYPLQLNQEDNSSAQLRGPHAACTGTTCALGAAPPHMQPPCLPPTGSLLLTHKDAPPQPALGGSLLTHPHSDCILTPGGTHACSKGSLCKKGNTTLPALTGQGQEGDGQ